MFIWLGKGASDREKIGAEEAVEAITNKAEGINKVTVKEGEEDETFWWVMNFNSQHNITTDDRRFVMCPLNPAQTDLNRDNSVIINLYVVNRLVPMHKLVKEHRSDLKGDLVSWC